MPKKLMPTSLLQLRIELTDISPAIWRVVLVPDSITLVKLHRVIQASMGWYDCHLHEFNIDGIRYGIVNPDWGEDEGLVNEARKRLLQVLSGARKFTYTYDFGDSWEHTITVENQLHKENIDNWAHCLLGENHCPPEDVGGAHGYFEFLEAMHDPSHEEHELMKEWWGGTFDPRNFDLAMVNQQLKGIKL